MLKTYFSSNYLFTPSIPGFPFHLSDKLYFQFGILLFVIALALAFFRRSLRNPVKKNLLKRWQSLTLTIGMLALVWTAFRYEDIPFFSMRIWIWVIYIIGLIWAGYVLKYWLKHHKKHLLEFEAEEIKKRYM